MKLLLIKIFEIFSNSRKLTISFIVNIQVLPVVCLTEFQIHLINLLFKNKIMIIRTVKSFLSKKRYRYLIYATSSVLLIGVLGFRLIEHWRWIDCLNYAVSTMVTTGNAGVLPKSDIGKIFNVFYMFTSVILILFFVNTMTQHFHEMRKNHEVRHQRHKDIVDKHMSEDPSN